MFTGASPDCLVHARCVARVQDAAFRSPSGAAAHCKPPAKGGLARSMAPDRSTPSSRNGS